MAKRPTRKPMRKILVPKECFFCKEKKEPSFWDNETLRRFVSDRGKIVGRARSGLCAMHQRHLTSEIKYARHLALLPFTGRY